MAVLAILGHQGLAQEVEYFAFDRNQAVYQDSADSFRTISLQPGLEEWSSFNGYFSAMVVSGSISGLTVTNPAGTEILTIPLYQDNEYGAGVGFDSVEERNAALPAGTYTFKGTGSSVGAFEVQLVAPGPWPISNPKVTNFDALQSFDPAEEVTITWQPFTLLSGEEGFIEVEVSFWNGTFSETVWESEEITPADSFGLPPTTTSITIPANRLVGSPYHTYDVDIVFVRVDDMSTTDAFGGETVVATVSSGETFLHIHPQPGERIYLTRGEIQTYPVFGPVYGYRVDWGFNLHTGLFNVIHTPEWIYQLNIGWLRVPSSGSMDEGLWFWSPQLSWIYFRRGWQGWYYSPGNGWNNMRLPRHDWQP